MCRREPRCGSSTSPRGRSRPSSRRRSRSCRWASRPSRPIPGIGLHDRSGPSSSGRGRRSTSWIINTRSSGTFTIPPRSTARSSITWYETGDGRAVAEFAVPRQATEATAATSHEDDGSTGSRSDGAIQDSARAHAADRGERRRASRGDFAAWPSPFRPPRPLGFESLIRDGEVNPDAGLSGGPRGHAEAGLALAAGGPGRSLRSSP